MKIGIAVPIFLNGRMRNVAYERVIHHYAKSGYPVHICGSEGRVSRRFAEQFKYDNVKYVEVPQMAYTTSSKGDANLRQKFNQSLFSLGPMDWYVLVGADDAAPLSVLDELSKYNHLDKLMLGVGMGNPLYIHDLPTNEKIRVNVRYYNYDYKLLPGINIFSLGAMMASEFKPYQLTGCETGAERYFEACGKVVPLDGYIVMFKTPYCLNNFEKIKRSHEWFACNEGEIKLIDEI